MSVLAEAWTIIKTEARDAVRLYFMPLVEHRRVMSLIALPLLVITFLLTRTQVVVLQADELVHRASLAERARPAGLPQRIRLRLIPDTVFPQVPVYVTERDVTDATPNVTTASGELPAKIAAMLAAHEFDWQHPLSAARFRDWRATLATRHDYVSVSNAGLLTLRTTTTDGDLREVELTVQRDTYRAVRQSWLFAYVGRLEIEEVNNWVKREPAAPAPPTAPPPSDLNASAHMAPSIPAPAAARPDLVDWRTRVFADAHVQTSFMPGMRADLAAVRRRLDALDSLASRIRDAEHGELPPATRAQLERRVEEESLALAARVNGLHAKTMVLFGVSPGPGSVVSSPRQTLLPDWPHRVADARQHAIALDDLLRTLRTQHDITPKQRQQGAEAIVALLNTLYDASLPPP